MRSEFTPAAFAELAAELQSQSDAALTERAIVEQLAEWVPDAEEVSLSTRVGGKFVTLAATGDLARRADALQYELDEGPCTDVIEHTSWSRTGDVGHDPRWPTWGPRAAEMGVRSMLSIQLLGSQGPVGGLNVYSTQPGRFTDRDEIDHGLIYGIHAANALGAIRTADHLHTALSSRHSIGMAQGVLMERYGLDQHQSFELLRRLSTTSNTKLREVAAALVATGQLPQDTRQDETLEG